jgi:hypothetical protein
LSEAEPDGLNDRWDGSADRWWDDLDAALLACLEAKGAMAPHDLGHHLGLSESAAASLVCLLALEGRVRISLVEAAGGRATDTRAA